METKIDPSGTEEHPGHGEEAPRRSHHAKTSKNPNGAGRPKKIQPPSDPDEEKAEAYRNLKLTPAVCKEFGAMLAQQVEAAYGVAARVFNDPRWRLIPEEVASQKSICTVGMLLYGDAIKDTIFIPCMLVAGLLAPVSLRLAVLGTKGGGNNAGAPNGPIPDGATVTDVTGARAA
jgi:hypothetical protein